jgi:hypothetical protein
LPGWARFTPGVSSRKKNNRPDRNLNTLGYSELYLMALLATKGMGRKTNSERQKRIQGLLGFRCWAFRVGTWATKDTLLFFYTKGYFKSPQQAGSTSDWFSPLCPSQTQEVDSFLVLSSQ